MPSLKKSKTNLTQAHRQWAERPADERFWTIDAMHKHCLSVDKSREVRMVDLKDLHFEEMTTLNLPMTNWAFQQLSRRLDLPAHLLCEMPEILASEVMNWKVKKKAEELSSNARVSIANGSIESIMTDKYSYIPNHSVCDGLRVLEGLGWKTAPARPSPGYAGECRKATKQDLIKNTNVKIGDLIAPAGLYASDRDMFAFMVHEGDGIDDGSGNELRRGVFVSNSEVGASAFKLTCFLYDRICGNHIVWGATDVVEARISHLGKSASTKIFGALENNLESWTGQSAAPVTQKIRAARRTILGENPEEVYESLVKVRKTYVARHHIRRAWDLVEEFDKDRVDVRSVWGMVTGYTRLSQELKNTDDRTYLEDTINRIMTLVPMN